MIPERPALLPRHRSLRVRPWIRARYAGTDTQYPEHHTTGHSGLGQLRLDTHIRTSCMSDLDPKSSAIGAG
jgi:hypothetical protein